MASSDPPVIGSAGKVVPITTVCSLDCLKSAAANLQRPKQFACVFVVHALLSFETSELLCKLGGMGEGSEDRGRGHR